MKVSGDGDRRVLVLPSELTVGVVASATSLAQSAFAGPPGSLTVDVGSLTAIDTAGLQLLLAVRASAAETGISFDVTSRSAALDRICGLYGVTLSADDTKAGSYAENDYDCG